MQTVRTALVAHLVLIGLFFASAGLVLAPGSALAQAAKKPECKCQNYGRYIMAGDTACIRTHKGPKMARCVMRGNVTDWDFLDEECAHTSMSTIPIPTQAKIKKITVLQ